MSTTEQTPRTPSTATGLFGMFGGLLHTNGSGAPKTSHRRRLVLAGIVSALCLIALAPAVASAARARVFTGAFGCAKGAPGCTTPDPYPLTVPAGVAVNEATGDVYVANNGVDDEQLLHIENATGGSFKLIVEDPLTGVKKETVSIAYKGCPGSAELHCSSAEIEQALEKALEEAGTPAGVGNVVVGGSGETVGVTFVGALTHRAVPTMTVETAGLTGQSPTLTVKIAKLGRPGDEVQEFNEKGEFVLMFGKDVNKKNLLSPDVCTEVEVEMGGECQYGIQGSEPGAFQDPAYVAVDGSGGAVYVGDGVDGLVTKFNEKGEVVSTWGDGGSGETPDGQLVSKPAVGPDAEECLPIYNACPAAEPFGSIAGMALDPKGNLWVGGAGHILEFERDGKFTGTAWEARSPHGYHEDGEGPNAVDSEDNVYVNVGIYDSEGAQLSAAPEGVEAVDSSGHAYVNAGEEIQVYVNCRAEVLGGCKPTESFGSAHPAGAGALAVDSAAAGDTLYAAGSASGQVLVYSDETVPGIVTGKPTEVAAPKATLTGAVDPSGVNLKECFFEWGEATSYGNVAPCVEGLGDNPGEIGAGTSEVPVHSAPIAGVQAGHTYHYRLVAINAKDEFEPSAGDGSDVAFGPPLIVGESSSAVAAGNATVQAEVDPQNLDTSLRVEYGTSTGYGKELPGAGIDSGQPSVPIELQSLNPDTVYHYRFVAENALGEGPGAIVGPDRSFRTQGAGAFTLPDGRQWEMASPPDMHGASIEPLNNDQNNGSVVQAAAQGGAITYLLSAPLETEVRGYGIVSQALSRRTPTGWSTRALAIPHAPSTSVGVAVAGPEYRFFSEDLSRAAVQPNGSFAPCENAQGAPQPCISPAAVEQTAVLEDTETGLLAPIVTHCPSAAEEEEEGHPCPQAVSEAADVPPGPAAPNACPYSLCGLQFEGASPDMKHVVIEGLREWSAGKLAPSFGGPEAEIASGNELTHPVSDDGSRVFFKSKRGNGNLYMRDIPREETIEIAGPDEVFEDASADGSRVFFAGQECEVKLNETTNKLECPVIAKDGEVIGASEDGSYVYFVSNEVLGDGVQHGAVSGNCATGYYEGTAQQSCNLYVSHGGVTKLIAVLSGADKPDWGVSKTARVSPNGEWLAFMSQRSLTGYDNRDAVSGEPDEEVYLYGAGSERLVCASCNPTGARPHGREYGTHEPSNIPLVGGSKDEEWRNTTWLAANIPSWTQTTYIGGSHQQRFLSNDGRLFFNSSDGLVPKDVNEQEDVYEYEPAGEGNCTEATTSGSTVYVPSSDGCVGLISSGTSAQESAFLDASETGSDVFFLTASHLSPQDVESGNAIYDAHECTSESPCLTPPSPPPPCETAEGCRAAPEPQPGIYGAPASATFNGLGNLAPAVTPPPVKKLVTKKTVKCKKGLVKNKQGQCVKSKPKKHKAKKSNRRAK